ncbi:MAG: hypothetical protein EPN21_14580 [Methylococcaceae bacterium]|nr:MAG: hypothetical protein EPN21_14580 [Methylococcaceae bacterium]
MPSSTFFALFYISLCLIIRAVGWLAPKSGKDITAQRFIYAPTPWSFAKSSGILGIVSIGNCFVIKLSADMPGKHALHAILTDQNLSDDKFY